MRFQSPRRCASPSLSVTDCRIFTLYLWEKRAAQRKKCIYYSHPSTLTRPTAATPSYSKLQLKIIKRTWYHTYSLTERAKVDKRTFPDALMLTSRPSPSTLQTLHSQHLQANDPRSPRILFPLPLPFSLPFSFPLPLMLLVTLSINIHNLLLVHHILPPRRQR